MTLPQIPGVRVRARRGGAAWEITADRLHGIQQVAVACVGMSSITSLDLTVAQWRAPLRGWMGRPGLPGLSGLLIEPKGSGVRLRLSVAEPTDPALLLAAAVRCLRPVPTGDIGSMLTFAPGLPVAAASLAGQLHDVLLPDESRDAHVRRCDLLLTGAAQPTALSDSAHTVCIDGSTWTRDAVGFDVSVDPTIHRPVGRRSVASGTFAAARVVEGIVTIDAEGGPVVVTGSVSAANVEQLRATSAVLATDMPVQIERQLLACGIPVAAAAHDLPDAGDHLAWQALSVHERRHAIRAFSPTAALDAWPEVSVVLVTHRPDHLERAFAQLARLRYPRLEIVVGAHGDRLDGARVWELAQSLPYPVTVVAIDGSRTLGEALQVCSDRASGALVTKMDDDDIYGPEHIWDLVLARQYSGAQVVGKALDWVYLESTDTTVFRPTYAAEKYADFVAGGTMLISKGDLAAVGGWRPVPKSVDRALLDRVLGDGGLVYRTHGLGYVYVRHSAGHTAAVRDEHFLTKTTSTVHGMVRHMAFGTDPEGIAGGAA